MSDCCILCSLKNQPFSRLDISAKFEILEGGRPITHLDIIQDVKIKGKMVKRHFHNNLLTTKEWLTGCNTQKKLFCWPCFLFDKDRTVWTSTGYSDLNHVNVAIKKHETALSHIRCSVELKTFGSNRVDLLLNDQLKQSVIDHNKKVDQNRKIMKRLIDSICFLGKQEMSLRGHDESDDASNKGNFLELISLLSEYDEILRSHISTAGVFMGTSNHIQNDLIDCVNKAILDNIKQEVKKTSFVAIMIDEATDISHKSQLSVVLRYVIGDQPVERFLGFFDVSRDRSASFLSEFVIKFVKDWDCGDKIVAQTYDGASVMSGALRGTQKLVRDVFPRAVFIHCCAHVLNLVLSQSTMNIKECNLFFAGLSSVSIFFPFLVKDELN